MSFARIVLLSVIAVGLISSDPALAAKKKKVKRAPGDIAYSRKGGEFPPAVFQHWRHVPQFRCYVCHSALFEMQQTEGQGERMHKADRCGSCHDGEPAFALGIQTCHRCHAKPPEAAGDKKKKKKKKKDKKVNDEAKTKGGSAKKEESAEDKKAD